MKKNRRGENSVGSTNSKVPNSDVVLLCFFIPYFDIEYMCMCMCTFTTSADCDTWNRYSLHGNFYKQMTFDTLHP